VPAECNPLAVFLIGDVRRSGETSRGSGLIRDPQRISLARAFFWRCAVPDDPKLLAKSIDQHVARRLRAARREKGLSQEAVSGLLGLTFQQLQKYEKGTNRVPVGRLAMLCHYYGKDIRWFFVGLPSAVNGSGAMVDIEQHLLALPHGRDVINAAVTLSTQDRALLAAFGRAMARPAVAQAAE
jgi:transcriptional regulator with XRE-family HTH domain